MRKPKHKKDSKSKWKSNARSSSKMKYRDKRKYLWLANNNRRTKKTRRPHDS